MKNIALFITGKYLSSPNTQITVFSLNKYRVEENGNIWEIKLSWFGFSFRKIYSPPRPIDFSKKVEKVSKKHISVKRLKNKEKTTSVFDELTFALVGMGFDKKKVVKVINLMKNKENENKTFDSLIRVGLDMLSKES